MAYSKEKRREYYLRYKANKDKAKKKYKKHAKIGNWDVEYCNKKDVVILSNYLKFRFYTVIMTYDDEKYEPIRRKIHRSVGFDNITTIDKGRVQVYVKGIDNAEAAIDNINKVMSELESIYGTEYHTARKREYKKKLPKNLES